MGQRLDQQQHQQQAHNHLGIEHLAPKRTIGHQRHDQQRERGQDQAIAHLTRLQPVPRKPMQGIARGQQHRGRDGQGGRQHLVVGTHDAYHIGQQQCDFRGGPRIACGVAQHTHDPQRPHKGCPDRHQGHRTQDGGARSRQRGQRKAAHPRRRAVGPTALAALTLNAHQQATAQRTGQDRHRLRKVTDIAHLPLPGRFQSGGLTAPSCRQNGLRRPKNRSQKRGRMKP